MIVRAYDVRENLPKETLTGNRKEKKNQHHRRKQGRRRLSKVESVLQSEIENKIVFLDFYRYSNNILMKSNSRREHMLRSRLRFI